MTMEPSGVTLKDSKDEAEKITEENGESIMTLNNIA